MLKEDVTRSIIGAVLERAGTLGLDMAGGFLGPAWPFVKPLLEAALRSLSGGLASRYRSPGEKAEQMLAELQAKQEEMRRISEVLDEHGVSAEWTREMLSQLGHLSDDMIETLAQFGQMNVKLDKILAFAKDGAGRRPGKLVVRGQGLEYVDFLRVSAESFEGYDLVPASFQEDAIANRHMPAGFLVWNFMIANWEGESAAVSRFELLVDDEQPYPLEARLGELKPELDPIEDRIDLERGVRRHRLFAGRRFQYKQDDFDAFRVLVAYPQSGDPAIQRFRLRIGWSNSTGDHYTYGPPLFLASLEKPQLDLARSKFGMRRTGDERE